MMRRISAVLAVAILCAACGRGDADAAKGGTAAADTAAADSSAMGIARSVLGPQVRMAVPFTIQPRDARFIAAALPVMEWVDDVVRSGNAVAPGGHEMVILELRGGSWAVHKPGLYASREPFLPRLDDTSTVVPADSATLSRVMGVEDADGDGFPEVWTAQFTRRDRAHAWEVRAFNRDRRILYRGEFPAANGGAGLDSARASFSEPVTQSPAARQWLVARAEALEAQFRAQGGSAAPGSAPAAGTPR
jgi:hypothetical protein